MATVTRDVRRAEKRSELLRTDGWVTAVASDDDRALLGKESVTRHRSIPPQVINAWLYRLLQSAGPPV
jgi:hypothetical protein